MDNITRTCANCAAYLVDPIEPITCMNLVSFVISPGKSRDPVSTDTCHDHMTQAEHDDGSGFARANRHAIEAQAATQALLAKLRNLNIK